MREDDQRPETMSWFVGAVAILLASAALVGSPQAPPRCVTHVETLDYTPLTTVARAATLQGDVKILLDVAANGLVRSAKAVSGDPLLGKIAKENAKAWRFAPGADSEYRVVYEFRVMGPPTETSRFKMSFDFPDHVVVISQPMVPSYSSGTPARK